MSDAVQREISSFLTALVAAVRVMPDERVFVREERATKHHYSMAWLNRNENQTMVAVSEKPA